MKILTSPQQITPPYITKPNSWPQTNRRQPSFPPPRTWRVHGGAKGFTSRRKDSEPVDRKGNSARINAEKNSVDDDDKIADVVWERMITRILFNVGGALATGFALLQVFSVLKEQGLWDVPKWLPFLTTFVTFGASALGIAYGSLSTSLDAEKEGSFLGFEQVEKNWVEMWKEEDE